MMKVVGWIQLVLSIVGAVILFFYGLTRPDVMLVAVIVGIEGGVMGMTILYASRVPEIEGAAKHNGVNIKTLGKRTSDLQVEVTTLKNEVEKLKMKIEKLENEK